MTIYNGFTRFAVPVFFMLSGLFLVTSEREDIAVGKRVLKLVVLFYVWSAFYAFQGVAVTAERPVLMWKHGLAWHRSIF